MPFGGANSERVLILAPHGRDAEVASKLLQEAGWPAFVCSDLSRLSEEVTKGAGCAVLVEDAVASDDISGLAASLDTQPPWSDFPIVVQTARADVPERNALAIRLQDALGNVTFLERPFHPTTLVNIVRAALRSRRRQYGAREVLERRDLLARELQHRTKNLLAVIQAIASASLQESHGKETFFDRLHALAKAQDLIIEAAGRGALMRHIVENALAIFGTRVTVDGPEVFLNPRTAQGFALALHELTTNAAKHGSLSAEGGTVSVHWAIDATTTEPMSIFVGKKEGAQRSRFRSEGDLARSYSNVPLLPLPRSPHDSTIPRRDFPMNSKRFSPSRRQVNDLRSWVSSGHPPAHHGRPFHPSQASG
jgi:two-component sensor histidine kinase